MALNALATEFLLTTERSVANMVKLGDVTQSQADKMNRQFKAVAQNLNLMAKATADSANAANFHAGEAKKALRAIIERYELGVRITAQQVWAADVYLYVYRVYAFSRLRFFSFSRLRLLPWTRGRVDLSRDKRSTRRVAMAGDHAPSPETPSAPAPAPSAGPCALCVGVEPGR